MKNLKITKLITIFITFIFLLMGSFNNYQVQAVESIDSTFLDAQDFIDTGEKEETINEQEMAKLSDYIYNVLLAIALIVAVVVGIILGIQFMLGSVEAKAEYKQALIPYFAGCIVVFGAFGIWKLCVEIFSKF